MSGHFSCESFFRSLLESSEVFAALLADLALDRPTRNEDPCAPLADALTDQVEVRFRSHTLKLIDSVLDEQTQTSESHTSRAVSALGFFWSQTVNLCLHWVTCHRRYDKNLVASSVKKIPFTLLDDLLDGLPIADAQTFWRLYLTPSLPILLSLESTSNLIFLKTCNAFWKRCCLHGSVAVNESGRWASLALQTLSESFPLGERSAMRVWGSRNLETLPEMETPESYEQHAQPLDADALNHVKSEGMSGGASDKQGAISYNVYQSLWGLHNDFSSPFIKNVGIFLSRIKTVLQVLEVSPVADNGGKGVTASETLEGQVTGQYLTHARLLPYQLQDPYFRAHFLTQFLIVSHHLTREAPAVGGQLEESRNLASSQLQACEPHLFEALSQVLASSEPNWMLWKQKKCPELDMKENAELASRLPAPKRPRLSDDGEAVQSGSTEIANILPPMLHLSVDLPGICHSLRPPQLEHHLEEYDYLDALDPESGIEAEYNPKNNPFFCWQALRLMPVSDFDKIQYSNGDFEAAIRHIWKRDKAIDIPGDEASFLPVSDFEDLEKADKTIDKDSDDFVEEPKLPLDQSEVDKQDNAQESDDSELWGERQPDFEKDEDAQIGSNSEKKSTGQSNEKQNGRDKSESDFPDTGTRKTADDELVEGTDKNHSMKSKPEKPEIQINRAHPGVAKNRPTHLAREQSPPRNNFSSERSNSEGINSRGRGNVPAREGDAAQRGPMDRRQQTASQQLPAKDQIRRGGVPGGRDRSGHDPRATDESTDLQRDREEQGVRWGPNRGPHKGGSEVGSSGGGGSSSAGGKSGGYGQQIRDEGGLPAGRGSPNARDYRGPPPGRNERGPIPSREGRWGRDERRVDRRDGGEPNGGTRGQSRDDGRRQRR